MESSTLQPHDRRPLELFYASLRGAARALSFPCDPAGHVDLDRLSDDQRSNYLFARVVAGNELAWPVVRPMRAA